MKSASVFGAMLAIVLIADVAHAVPTAYYNPATGGLFLKNDSGSSLAAIAVWSPSLPSVMKSDPNHYASIPEAIFDPGDLPLGFTYLKFPDTGVAPFGLRIGDVVLPGIAASALTGVFLPTGEEFPTPQLAIVEIPEPPKVALAGLGPAAMFAAARRQPRQSTAT